MRGLVNARRIRQKEIAEGGERLIQTKRIGSRRAERYAISPTQVLRQRISPSGDK
jgi:hypothetical protein